MSRVRPNSGAVKGAGLDETIKLRSEKQNAALSDKAMPAFYEEDTVPEVLQAHHRGVAADDAE